MAYLRQVRMARAHEELLAADSERTTASTVARKWGFGHYGRFAAESPPRRYAPSADIPNSDPGLITLQHSAI
jgi:AraC-like DNA-binding protein